MKIARIEAFQVRWESNDPPTAGSARVGLWVGMALMGCVCLWRVLSRPVPWRAASALLAALSLLVCCFSVSNATLWIACIIMLAASKAFNV